MPYRKDEGSKEDLAEVNRKISEIKKKIQLSEGQRKAHFEECDAEKKANVEKIAALKKEVKEIYRQLAEPFYESSLTKGGRRPNAITDPGDHLVVTCHTEKESTEKVETSTEGKEEECEDSLLRTSHRYPKDVGALRNKKLEEAIDFMDLKCIDLNKRMDVLKYRIKMKKMMLKKLAEEFRDMLIRSKSKKCRKDDTVNSKPVSVLENQIHRVELNMMEAEHVNKKYRTIRLQLMSESVEFESALKKLEEEIEKQEAEIKNLEMINKEALGLRDVTKGSLLRHEISALSAGKMREAQLQDFRLRVEERKLELEKLERRISPTGRVMFEEGEGAQASQGSDGAGRTVAQLEAHFAKLKVATGETETEEVLPRFLSQRETKQRLDFLKRITEEEKKQLELRKELSLAELEAFKFAEVKEKEESQEEIEKMNLAIESEKKLKERHLREVSRVMEQLVSIRKLLYRLIDQLQGMNEEPPPEPPDDVGAYSDILACLTRKIQSGLARMGFGENFRDTLKILEQNQYQHFVSNVSIQIPGGEAPLFSGLSQQDEGKQAKGQQPSLLAAEEEDEEDVLSRAYVKRQAQLIVDAKSRKKFNRVLNFPRAKK